MGRSSCRRAGLAPSSLCQILFCGLLQACQDGAPTPRVVEAAGSGGGRGHLSAVIKSCDAGTGIAPAEVTCVGDFGGLQDVVPAPEVTFAWTFGDEAVGDEAEGDAASWGKRPTHWYSAPGDYVITLTVTVVDGGQTAEAIERVTITGAANLIVSHLSFDPAEVDSGGLFTASVVVENTGAAPASNSSTCVVIARSRPVTSNTGAIVGFVDADGIEGGGTLELAGEVTIPPVTDTRSYFVGACADCNNDVDEGEANEGDNCFEAEGTLAVGPLVEFPDLTGRDVSANPSEPLRGGAIELCYVVENFGERPVFGFGVELWAARGADADDFDPADPDNSFPLGGDRVGCPPAKRRGAPLPRGRSARRDEPRQLPGVCARRLGLRSPGAVRGQQPDPGRRGPRGPRPAVSACPSLTCAGGAPSLRRLVVVAARQGFG